MPVPDLIKLVSSLDGEASVGDDLRNELQSVALPPLFRQDLAEWLDVDLLQSTLTETELQLIRSKDADYVNQLRRHQLEHARALGTARGDGSLAEAPGVAATEAQRTYREINRLQGEERGRKAKEFGEQLRSDLLDSDAGLYALLRATVASFIWRPTAQTVGEWLSDDASRVEVEELIGAQLAPDDQFFEIAYYRGVLYHIFPSDQRPTPLVISTDHETAWRPGFVDSVGSIADFLSSFLSVSATVSLVADEMP